jgi:hypothetical protein
MGPTGPEAKNGCVGDGQSAIYQIERNFEICLTAQLES